MALAAVRVELGFGAPGILDDRDIIIDERRLVFGVNEPLRVPYASGWELFKGAFFLRDAAQIAQDRVDYDPTFTSDVLTAIATLQGTQFNELSEEEPGKPHHEWRSDVINGDPVPDKQRDIIRELGSKMGGDEHHVQSHVSADAAVIFLQTLYKYLDTTGDTSILNREYYDKDATSREDLEHKHTLAYAAEKATEWVADTITYGPLLHNRDRHPLPAGTPKLLTWQHFNDNGVHNQTLRDSEEAEFHPSGEKAHQGAPRADTGLQGLAYDVLKRGALLFHRPEWRELATEVQQSTLKELWMEDAKYFAQGMDYDPETGEPRQIKTLCANVGELLDSDILLDLPEEEAHRYIEGIATMLFSDEFITQYGIRTQGKRHINALQVVMPGDNVERITGYHGPETIWPVINGRIINGLRHTGLFGLAENIRTKISNTFDLIGCHAEFVNVGPHEELGIAAGPLGWGTFTTEYEFNGTNTPEYVQGWSWSLNEREHLGRRGWGLHAPPETWTSVVETKILAGHSIRPFVTPEDIEYARAHTVLAPINVKKGRSIQAELFRKWKNGDGLIQLYGE